jgi:hypothetical protein
VPLVLENLDVNADFDLSTSSQTDALINDLKNNSDGIDDILSAVEMHKTLLQNSSVQNLQTTSVQNFQNKSFPIQFPMISNCSNFTINYIIIIYCFSIGQKQYT